MRGSRPEMRALRVEMACEAGRGLRQSLESPFGPLAVAIPVAGWHCMYSKCWLGPSLTDTSW